jgi:hypothetical protein
MMEDLDKRIAHLGGDADDTVVVEDTGDMPEEIKLTDDEVPDFMNVDDQRQRPSSEHSKIDSASEELHRMLLRLRTSYEIIRINLNLHGYCTTLTRKSVSCKSFPMSWFEI